LAVEPEFVAQPDAVAERAPGHVPDHLPHEHFEFFRIDVHSSLHFLAERPRLSCRGRLQDLEARKTTMAAPVSFSRWFYGAPDGCGCRQRTPRSRAKTVMPTRRSRQRQSSRRNQDTKNRPNT